MIDKTKGQTLYFSQWGGERAIPEAFIAAMERAEERTSGYAIDEEIPDSVKSDPDIVEAYFDSRERRTNEKVLVIIRKKNGVVGPLLDFRTTAEGQSVQVASTMFRIADTTFVKAIPTVTQDVAIRDLGNGWAIQEVAVSGTFVDDVFTPGIFQGVELTTRREDPLPSSIRGGLPLEEVQSIVEGTVTQPTLDADDLEARERQVGQDKKLLSRLSRDGITLPKVEKAGVELTDLLPARFRGLVPTTRTTTVANGTVTTPTLGAGELLRSEEQFTALVKLIEIISRSGVTFPIVVTDTATTTEYGGGAVTITSSIAVEGTYSVQEGEGVVSSKITKLGEGHEIRETVARVAGAWPTRPFARWIGRLQTFITGTRQVVAKLSTTSGVSGADITEVEPIDGYREDKIVSTQPLTILDTYIRKLYGNNTNLNLSPELTALIGYIDRDGGAGSYSENGTYSLGGSAYGGGSIQLHGSAQASSSALPELGYTVKLPKTSNVPCVHVIFYVANNTSRAGIITDLVSKFGAVTDWPDFRPQPVVVVSFGGKGSFNVQVNVSAHESLTTDYLGAMKFNGNSRHSGAGGSFDVARITRVIHIPETIHGILTVTNEADLWTDYFGARGVITSGVNSVDSNVALPIVAVRSRGFFTIVDGASATAGTASYSGLSGNYVHRLITELDPEFNRTRVFAEIVNANDFKP